MKIKENCQNCELFRHCEHYGEIPKENTCSDWEINFKKWQKLTDEEKNEFIKKHPEYK